jgi:hypothetical protein
VNFSMETSCKMTNWKTENLREIDCEVGRLM